MSRQIPDFIVQLLLAVGATEWPYLVGDQSFTPR